MKTRINGENALRFWTYFCFSSIFRVQRFSVRCFCQSAFAFSGLFKTGLVSFEDSAAKKHQALTSDIRLEHLQIYADTTKMQQVVTNILSNAVKYTPDGGTTSIIVTEHPVREAGKTAVVCVIRDTGIGISKVFLLHIFDQFEREHNTTSTGIEGSGLGMLIETSAQTCDFSRGSSRPGFEEASYCKISSM